MRFTPKTEKEIEEANLWPAAIYDFEITDAKETQSKAGNEMIVLDVRVYNNEGGQRMVTDFLLESMAYKLRHCADVCGLLAEYESGHLTAHDFVGKTGKLKLGIEKSRDANYADKNRVNDYVKREGGAAVNGTLTTQRDPALALDDEILF